MHKVRTKYLASDVQADILIQLGCQQRSYSASEFHPVEMDKEKVYVICSKRTTCYLLQNTGRLANVAVLPCSFAQLHLNCCYFYSSGGVNTSINIQTLITHTPKYLSMHMQALQGVYSCIKVKWGLILLLNAYIWWHIAVHAYIYIYLNIKSI